MRQTVSFEKVGTAAYFFMVVTDNNGARVSGLDETDFSFTLFNPAEADIAGATSITVSELGSSGAYYGFFTLPSSQGEYTLTLVSAVHPPVTGRTVTFLAYTLEFGDSGDSTAQIDFKVIDENGIGVTGLDTDDFTLNLWNPSLAEVSGSVAVTVVELSNGGYRAIFSAISEEGKWFLDLLTTDADGQPNYWTPGGKQGVHKYKLETVGIVPGQPAIAGAVNDDTGNSGTLDLVADNAADELFIYYRILTADLWTLFGGSRTGSGELQITSLLNNTIYEFVCVASRSGSPTSYPSVWSTPVRLYITDNSNPLTAIFQALYDWVDAASPLEPVWMPSNATRQALPYVGIRAMPLATIASDSHLGPDENGEEEVIGDREFQFTAEVLGTNSPQAAAAIFSYAEQIASSLQKESVRDTLAASGVVFVDVLPTQDLTGIGSIKWQSRALVEVRFRIANEITDTINWIETVEDPSGTYEL